MAIKMKVPTLKMPRPTRKRTVKGMALTNGASKEHGHPSSDPDKSFIEFFAGIGLVDEGLRPSGWRCIYANDNDARKQAMHAARNGPVPHYHLEDVEKTAKIAEHITGVPFLATASFPCTDLSVAGHYRGFDGRHSSTFFAFADVLQALGKRRPKVVMLENVVGFLSARKGDDFTAAVRKLAGLGYWMDAFVLNAANFVPQSRPRVFVIAKSPELLPPNNGRDPSCPFSSLEASPIRPAPILHFMKTVELPTGWSPQELPLPPKRRTTLEDFIDLDDAQEWWESDQVERHYKMMSNLHRRQVDVLLATRTSFLGTIFRRIRQEVQRAEVRFDGLAGCLRTPKGGSGRQIIIASADGRLRMRWMSAREYARLQGAPDFPLTLPCNQLLFGFADAVCVPAIQWIDKHVLTPLYESAHPATGNDKCRTTSRLTNAVRR